MIDYRRCTDEEFAEDIARSIADAKEQLRKRLVGWDLNPTGVTCMKFGIHNYDETVERMRDSIEQRISRKVEFYEWRVRQELSALITTATAKQELKTKGNK